MGAFLKAHKLPKTKFAKLLEVTPGVFNKFMGKKGIDGGSGSGAYFAAYDFFEKMRIANKEPKSAVRKKIEKRQKKFNFSKSIRVRQGNPRRCMFYAPRGRGQVMGNYHYDKKQYQWGKIDKMPKKPKK